MFYASTNPNILGSIIAPWQDKTTELYLHLISFYLVCLKLLELYDYLHFEYVIAFDSTYQYTKSFFSLVAVHNTFELLQLAKKKQKFIRTLSKKGYIGKLPSMLYHKQKLNQSNNLSNNKLKP